MKVLRWLVMLTSELKFIGISFIFVITREKSQSVVTCYLHFKRQLSSNIQQDVFLQTDVSC